MEKLPQPTGPEELSSNYPPQYQLEMHELLDRQYVESLPGAEMIAHGILDRTVNPDIPPKVNVYTILSEDGQRFYFKAYTQR